MAGPVRVISWDWREQVDIESLAKAVHDLSGGTVFIQQVETCSDQYAVVVANEVLDDKARLDAYEATWS